MGGMSFPPTLHRLIQIPARDEQPPRGSTRGFDFVPGNEFVETPQPVLPGIAEVRAGLVRGEPHAERLRSAVGYVEATRLDFEAARTRLRLARLVLADAIRAASE